MFMSRGKIYKEQEWALHIVRGSDKKGNMVTDISIVHDMLS